MLLDILENYYYTIVLSYNFTLDFIEHFYFLSYCSIESSCLKVLDVITVHRLKREKNSTTRINYFIYKEKEKLVTLI